MYKEKIEIYLGSTPLVKFETIDGIILVGDDVEFNGEKLDVTAVGYHSEDRDNQTMRIYLRRKD